MSSIDSRNNNDSNENTLWKHDDERYVPTFDDGLWKFLSIFGIPGIVSLIVLAISLHFSMPIIVPSIAGFISFTTLFPTSLWIVSLCDHAADVIINKHN